MLLLTAPDMFARGRSDTGTAHHAHQFLHPLVAFEYVHAGCGSAGLDDFLNVILMVCKCGYLCEVCHAKYLVARGQLSELITDRFGGFASDSSIHLVENQRFLRSIDGQFVRRASMTLKVPRLKQSSPRPAALLRDLEK